MFDGTDLSLAYGGSVYDPSPMPQVAQVAPPPPPPMPTMEVPKSTVSHAQPPDIIYNPPSAMYAQQPMATVPQDSFWDKISNRKMDVLKLFILAMVVLLGISMDRVATHYLTTYVGKAFLSETQEFLVRLSYPVIVLLVIWFIKALT
jgi:hypothetical protein